MNVTYCPSVDWLRAISDLDEKLVTIWSELEVMPLWVLFGTVSEEIRLSLLGSISSSTIGWVTPKLASGPSLLKTNGYVPRRDRGDAGVVGQGPAVRRQLGGPCGDRRVLGPHAGRDEQIARRQRSRSRSIPRRRQQ